MFELMIRWQKPVLIFAGIMMALFFGMTDVFRSGSRSGDGRVDESGITMEERRSVLTKLRIREIVFGEDIPSDQLDATIQSYVSNLRKAQAANLKVPDEQVRRTILNQFGGEKRYRQFVQRLKAQNGVRIGELEETIRDTILFQQLYQFQSLSVYVTGAEVKELFHDRFDTVDYEVFRINREFVEVPESELTEEKVKNYYEANKESELFMEPEKVKVAYLFLDPALLKTSEPGDAELRQYYNLNRSNYPSWEHQEEVEPYFAVIDKLRNDWVSEQQRDLARMLLRRIDVELIINPDFDAAYAKFSKMEGGYQHLVKGVTQPFSRDATMVEPLGVASDLIRLVFSDPPQNYGGPLETSSGIYLYHLVDRTEKRLLSFEEARETAEENLAREKRTEATQKVAEDLAAELKSTSDWGSIDISERVAIQYSSEPDTPLMTREAAFAAQMEPGVVSEPFQISDGLAIVRLIERKAAPEEEMDEEIASRLREDAMQRKMQALQYTIQ